MDNRDKIKAIQYVINHPGNESVYYDLLKKMEDVKYHYWEYMKTEPINCDEELERLPNADYELCTALLTMLLREDHFSNGSLMNRYEAGQVDAILNKMIELLKV